MIDRDDNLETEDRPVAAALGRIAAVIEARTYAGPSWQATYERQRRRRRFWAIGLAAAAVVLAALGPWRGAATVSAPPQPPAVAQSRDENVSLPGGVEFTFGSQDISLPSLSPPSPQEHRASWTMPTITFELSERSSDHEVERVNRIDGPAGAGGRTVDLL